MKILTERQYNAVINQAYWQGYKTGYAHGEQGAEIHNKTMNSLREKLGLPPLPKKEDITERGKFE